ncbi:MAG: 3-phosphoshikimate 1-carboxyvinyltransferase [Rhodospirillales bacterium]
MRPLISRRAGKLSGEISVSGDKSISHRALIIGSVAVGETRILNLLESEDVLRTVDAVRALGAQAEKSGDGSWIVSGCGVGGLVRPDSVLDMGNSGTAARLLIGLLATHPFDTGFSGDDSLSSRPMNRVMEPLERMGATFKAAQGGRLPLTVTGAVSPIPIEYRMEVPSAQVKSAVLLGGLNAPGVTRIVEDRPSRDHTELMLRHFGAQLKTVALPGGGREIALRGQPELNGSEVNVPADISSAAFPLVAALLVKGSELTLRGVGINPLRCGLLETLNEMGAAIVLGNPRHEAGEAIADIMVKTAPLKGVEVAAGRAPSMIDEYPILAIAAACANGITRMNGLAELKVKESDRLRAIVQGLGSCGVKVEEGADWLAVHGKGPAPKGGARITAGNDHRIAMSFLVLGMAAGEPVGIDDSSSIATSFPGFVEMMNSMGANIKEGG